MRVKEIFIYDFIGGDWYYGYGVTAKSFRAELTAAQKDSDLINVRINSPGGSVFEGISIHNLIAESKVPVHTYIDGIAYSMAAIIALAGKKVFAAKNTTMMLHNASGSVFGNANDIAGALEMINKLDGSLAISVADKTGMTEQEVKDKWFDYKDHTLSAQDALDAKLIDEIVGENKDKKLAAMSMEQAVAHFAKAHQNGTGESFLSKIKNIVTTEIKNIITPKSSDSNNYNPMNLEKALKALKAGATAEEIAEAIAEVNQFTGANERFTKAEVDAKVQAEADKTAEAVTTAVKVVQDAFDAFKAAAAVDTNDPKQKGPDKITAPMEDNSDDFAHNRTADKVLPRRTVSTT